MEKTAERIHDLWAEIKPLLHFRPVSGQLWFDTLLLLVVGTMHHTVLPSLTSGVFAIDLMTPWIVTTLVLETLPRGLFLAAVGALILETHSAAPAGFYLCSYWVITAVIHLTRDTLSWRHIMPWAFTYGISQLWLVCFSTFVLVVNSGTGIFSWAYLRVQSEMLFTGIGIGLILCHRHLATGIRREEA